MDKIWIAVIIIALIIGGVVAVQLSPPPNPQYAGLTAAGSSPASQTTKQAPSGLQYYPDMVGGC